MAEARQQLSYPSFSLSLSQSRARWLSFSLSELAYEMGHGGGALLFLGRRSVVKDLASTGDGEEDIDRRLLLCVVRRSVLVAICFFFFLFVSSLQVDDGEEEARRRM